MGHDDIAINTNSPPTTRVALLTIGGRAMIEDLVKIVSPKKTTSRENLGCFI